MHQKDAQPPTRLQSSGGRQKAQNSSLRLGCTGPASLISPVEIGSDHPALLGHVGLQYCQPMSFTWPSTNGCHCPMSTQIPITTSFRAACLYTQHERQVPSTPQPPKSQLSECYGQKTELLFRHLSWQQLLKEGLYINVGHRQLQPSQTSNTDGKRYRSITSE